jgi:hypothetical protein
MVTLRMSCRCLKLLKTLNTANHGPVDYHWLVVSCDPPSAPAVVEQELADYRESGDYSSKYWLAKLEQKLIDLKKL